MRQHDYSRLRNPLPWQPKPIPKEETEEQLEKLITPEHVHHDPRPEVVKPFSEIKIPRYNKMYGSNKVADSWHDLVDNYASGSNTVASATTSTFPVTLATAMDVRLSQWPGAIHFFLCVRGFSNNPQVPISTTVSLMWYFIDNAGRTTPLGVFPTSGGVAQDMCVLLPDAITDVGNTNIGNLQAVSTSGTVGQLFDWQLSFSYAFLIPALKPYEVIHQEDLLDAHEGHVRTIF